MSLRTGLAGLLLKRSFNIRPPLRYNSFIFQCIFIIYAAGPALPMYRQTALTPFSRASEGVAGINLARRGPQAIDCANTIKTRKESELINAGDSPVSSGHVPRPIVGFQA